MGVLLEIGINLIQILEQDKNSAPATLDLISNVQVCTRVHVTPLKSLFKATCRLGLPAYPQLFT